MKNPIYVQADEKVLSYFNTQNVRVIGEQNNFDGTKAAFLFGKSTHNKSLSDWSDMKLVLSEHEGIVNSSTWLKCQEKLAKNKQSGNSSSNKSSCLSGQLSCGICGHTFTTIKSKRSDGSFRKYFTCIGKSHLKRCSGQKHTVYVEDTEKLVFDKICEKLAFFSPNVVAYDDSLSTLERGEILSVICEIEQQELQLADTFLDNTLNPELISALNKKALLLSKKKASLIKKLNSAKSEVNSISPPPLTSQFLSSSLTTKRAIISTLVSHIIIEENNDIEIIWRI